MAAAAEAEAAQAKVTYTCDAVAVSFFCIDETFESRSRDFLHAVFAAFPEKTSVLLTVPHAAAEIPLLSTFTQIEARPGSSFDHVLYLFHRGALLEPVAVRRGAASDAAALGTLTEGLAGADDIVAAATAAAASGAPGRSTLVVESCGQVVGAALIEGSLDVDAMRSLYKLEDLILFAEHRARQGIELLAFVINPIFAAASRFVLREAMRLQGASCLYYRTRRGVPVPDALAQFVQVGPRSQQVVHETDASDAAETPGALYLLTRKLMSEPKMVVNKRVVVVGSSDAALSVLESLATVPYLHFSSLFLVAPKAEQRLQSPRGARLSPGASLATCADAFFSRTCAYTARELAALNLGARVRAVEGRVVDIDRESCTLGLADGTTLKYDVVVMAPELGDQSLHELCPEAMRLRGVFSLSDEGAAAAALEYIEERRLTGRDAAPYAIYGGSLDAFAAVNALLTLNVAPSDLTLVVPPAGASQEQSGAPFGAPEVARRVEEALERLGVTTLRGWTLVGAGGDAGEGADHLSSLQLASSSPTSEPEERTVPCGTLLCCGERRVDQPLFQAFSDSSIVYNGGLIVDAQFRTNDAAIFAAGPLARVARRYRPKGEQAVSRSDRENGAQLAHALLPVLDPWTSPSTQTDEPPKPEAPVAVAVDLPGGLHYYCASAVKATPGSMGAPTEITTGDAAFCSCRVDCLGQVSSLVYLGPSPADEGNWARLIGLPVEMINRLGSKHREGRVDDVPTFLRETSVQALYHDRFGEFRAALAYSLRTAAEAAELTSGAGEGTATLELTERAADIVRASLSDFIAANHEHLGGLYAANPTSAPVIA